MVLRAILIWSPSGPIRRNKTAPPRVNSVWRFSVRAPMPYDGEAIGRIMMDDLARLYRFIEDAEFKAAILEVLLDLDRQLGELGTSNYH
jgi:hypothetical protein